MELITPQILKKAIAEQAGGEYSSIIEQLPVGSALRLHPSEWKRKEPCYHYFWRKYHGKIGVKFLNGYYYLIRKQ